MKKIYGLIMEIVSLSPILTFFIFLVPLYFLEVYWIKDEFGSETVLYSFIVFIVGSIFLTRWIRDRAYWWNRDNNQEITYQLNWFGTWSGSKDQRILKEYHKTIFMGILVFIFMLIIPMILVGNPLKEFLIELWGENTKGNITHSYFKGDDDAVSYFFYPIDDQSFDQYEGEFRYRGILKPKLSFIQEIEPYDYIEPEDWIPVDIEYFKYYPDINRIKGTGPDTFAEWFFLKFCLGLLLYIFFIHAGSYLIKQGLEERKSQNENLE